MAVVDDGELAGVVGVAGVVDVVAVGVAGGAGVAGVVDVVPVGLAVGAVLGADIVGVGGDDVGVGGDDVEDAPVGDSAPFVVTLARGAGMETKWVPPSEVRRISAHRW